MRLASLASVAAYSCWTRAQNCLCSRKVRGAFCVIGSVGARFIPVPFVNGALQGCMAFIAGDQLVGPPGSAESTRSWKRVLAGASIVGCSWGLGTLAFSSKNAFLIVLGMGAYIGGMYLGVKAYTNTLCARRVEVVQPPLESDLEPLIGQNPIPANA